MSTKTKDKLARVKILKQEVELKIIRDGSLASALLEIEALKQENVSIKARLDALEGA